MVVQSPPSPVIEPPAIGAPDAGVIEDARARQRRHRQAGAAATLIAAAIAAIVLATAGSGGGRGGRVPTIVRAVASRLPGLNLAHARLALTDTAADYQVWILPGGDSPRDQTCVAVVSLNPAVTHGSQASCQRTRPVRYWGMQIPIYANNPGGGVAVAGLEPGTASSVILVSRGGAEHERFPVSNHAYLVTGAAPGDKLVSTTATGARVTNTIAPVPIAVFPWSTSG